MSRAVAIDAPLGELRTGSWAEVEYDVPEEVWYFEQNDFPGAMPFSVVMEVVLQACGWLAAYVGSALTSEQTLLFRNLDGTGTVWREIGPDIGTLRTKTRLRELSRTSDMIIETFDIECSAGDEPIFSLSTVFGFFPPRAFDHQIGLPPSEEERSWLTQPSDVAFELGERPKQYFGESLRLPGPMLLMIDRVTGYWPGAGRAGLGRLRAEKNVDPGEWFFQAHFFQDPVQPGSLGVQAMCQLLQFYAIERGLGGALEAPRFRPILLGQPVTWKYRGQITPRNQKITIELEIVDVAEDEHETKITADGWLWADDTRIYHVRGLGIGIVPGSR